MEHAGFDAPAVTVALALAVGVVAQITARHLRMPGIVLLLGAGVGLGPDGAGILYPSGLGSGMGVLVSFAVAIILFDGGLQLNLRRLRREARSIRKLVTLGAATTAIGATIAAKVLMDWPWSTASLFGTLVIVTGPTVITPLLRRIRVQHRVSTVLEAEGVFGDAIGAILAVVALEVVLGREDAMGSAGTFLWETVSRLGFGLFFGGAVGYLLVVLFRIPRAIPEELTNIFTLAAAVAIFQLSNVIRPESGVLSVIMAGLAVGNARGLHLEEVKHFKEQLTTLLIGMLFVLLAADVRLSAIGELGWRGVATVAALILLVRPLAVWVSTRGTELKPKETLFLMWLAPRGIVAAAVASLFAQSLRAAGVEGGEALQALVFLVIGSTVILLGLPGGLVAGLLGLRRPSQQGLVILGANPVARLMGKILKESEEEVVLIDTNPEACSAAEADGLRVLYGNGMTERVQLAADIGGRAGVVAVVPNDAVSLLFARHVRKAFQLEKVWSPVCGSKSNVTRKQLNEEGLHMLFGVPRHLERWISMLETGEVEVSRWRLSVASEESWLVLTGADNAGALPLMHRRGRVVRPVDGGYTPKKDDEIWVLLEEAGAASMRSGGWTAAEQPAPASEDA